MQKTAPAALLALLLGACATLIPPPPGTARGRQGEKVYVDGPSVTPREVLEDSRCPAGVQCVWAGQVRIRATVHLGSGDQEVELTSGKPLPVADGTLELVGVLPPRETEPPAPGNYRFDFRFMGGL